MHALRQRVAFASDRGISLVEMVVALMIIGVVAGSFGLLMVSTLTASRTHEQRATANQLGQDQLESVLSRPWSAIGLYSGDTGYVATVNGESTVTLAGASTSASVKPTSTVTKSSVAYTVRTDITWTDDPSDGTGANDGNNNTQDDKHVLVTVTWTVSGKTRSVTFDDLRTPTASEAPPVAGSTFSVALGASATSNTLSSSGMFGSAMTFTATTTKVAASVTLKYTTRDGVQHSAAMTNASGGTSWTVTLGTTTGAFDTDTETFSAAASTGSLNASGTTTVSMVGSGTSTATISVLAAPSQTLSGSGALSNAITVSVTGSAAIGSGTLTYNTTSASPTTVNLSGSGTSWSYTIPVDATTYNAGLEVFTVSVTFNDNTTRTGTDSVTFVPSVVLPDVTGLVVNDPYGGNAGFCVDSTYHLYSAQTVDATVKNVATTDAVYVMAPAWMSSPGLGMTYLKTNADGSMVFRYTVAASSALPAATSIQLQSSATKVVNGASYSDNYITNPNIAIYVASNKNKCT